MVGCATSTFLVTSSLHPGGELLLIGNPDHSEVWLYNFLSDTWNCVSLLLDEESNFVDHHRFGKKVEFVPHPTNNSLDQVMVIGDR